MATTDEEQLFASSAIRSSFSAPEIVVESLADERGAESRRNLHLARYAIPIRQSAVGRRSSARP